jgi:GNAT superfamily N-acetyltransferase
MAIVRGLPDYFTPDVQVKIAHDLAAHGRWVITADGDDVTGFAIAEVRRSRAAEILWLAVCAVRRHRGIGTALLDHVLATLAAQGVTLVEAKTLDASAAYQPYLATRAFWERHGFVQVDTIDPLPGWRRGNPAAIYVCAVRPTRADVDRLPETRLARSNSPVRVIRSSRSHECV